MQNIIRTQAVKLGSAITRKPLSELAVCAVVGVLLLGAQTGMAHVVGERNAVTLAGTADLLESLITPRQKYTTPIYIQFNDAQLDAMVDVINSPDVLTTNQVAALKELKQADIRHNDSIARFVLNASPGETIETASTSFAPNKQYQFKSLLTDGIELNTNAKLIATQSTPTSQDAIWDTDKQFSLLSTTNAGNEPRATPWLGLGNKFVVMIDPGHGGIDQGSISHNNLKEKVLTLDIAKRAQLLLSDIDNVSVVLTRDGDDGLSRQERVTKVVQSKADMVVSLHLNHLPQADVNLVETFYAAPRNIQESLAKQRAQTSSNGFIKTSAHQHHDLSFTHSSYELAKLMQKNVFDEVRNNNPNTDNAGVKQQTLYILTRSFTPGVLIEMSCLSNEEEAERLADPAYRQKLAEALADGIRDYLDSVDSHGQIGVGV